MFLDERSTHKCLLIKRYLIKFTDRPVPKMLDIFYSGLLQTISAYFVCVLSVLYTVSVLILHRESFPSSAITPSCVLIRQNVAHPSDSKSYACVMMTAICDRTEKKPSRNFNSGVSLGKPE